MNNYRKLFTIVSIEKYELLNIYATFNSAYIKLLQLFLLSLKTSRSLKVDF